ncbi:MAG: hypothetical protein IKI37_10775 [Oscillospiraceae bacterium]|nr:hypothetical protein [Oscillospiraceae bacterium]
MKLCRIKSEFASEELAELAAGRIRRSLKHVRSLRIRKLGKGLPSMSGKERFTMLPANLRMENYATDVLISELSDSSLPEHWYRKTAELTVVCDIAESASVSAIMQSLGAMQIRPV